MGDNKKPQASWGGSHWGMAGLYFFLVLDQADETVLGRRGLRIADLLAMLKGAARRGDGLTQQVRCHGMTA